ncbi:MAG TPA: penicillin-binding protein 2 [Bauldia sp.]|nr:penicillin-binding protein 2 [Bauldia sp.]
MTGVDLTTMPSEQARQEAEESRFRPAPEKALRPRADNMRGRIKLAGAAFALAYLVIVGRLIMFGVMDPVAGNPGDDPNAAISASRPDLVDRNGDILATDIRTASLYGEPRNILDPDEAAELITSVLPDLDAATLRKRLSGNAGFVWIKREITPKQQQQIHALGIPGIGFLSENRRFYPGGPTAAHILGAVNVDNAGIAGIEKYIDDRWLRDLHAAGFAAGDDLDAVQLSIDLRIQHILRDELAAAMERYRAIAAAGVVLNVHTGEVLAMASLPDYDPNNPVDALKPDRLNRMTTGVYELGSVFKGFTLAMALDAGKTTMNDRVDATSGIRVGRFTINDFHGKRRVLTIPEVFIYSSNIGAARLALRMGAEGQQDYLRRLGLMTKVETELPEIGKPIIPAKWGDLTTMTVAFGHGLAVTPLQVAVADMTLVNGGLYIPPTFFPRTREEADKIAVPVLSPQTSADLRSLFALNVEKGSGTRAAVPGYMVGGKTGTAEKVDKGRYSSDKRLNSFLAAFPMDDPQYAVLVMLDEPKPEKPGASATAGLNAAPTVGAVVRRSAALLGVKPRTVDENGAILVSN